MALADYRLCDRCGSKAFYDAELNYVQGKEVDGSVVRNGGVVLPYTKLDMLGDWMVLCLGCAQTHRCVIVSRTPSGAETPKEGRDG